MKTGRVPTNCTLYGVASLSDSPSASASSSRSRCSSAAARSIPKVHSYG